MIATTPSRPWPMVDSCSNANPPSIGSPSCPQSLLLQTDDPRGPHGLPPQFPTSSFPNHRRSLNSLNPARKPLRSSPLAGPALRIIGDEESLRPSRTTSTPDLISLAPPPRLRHARPKTAENPLRRSQFSTSLSPGLLQPPPRSFLREDLRLNSDESTQPVIQAPPILGSLSALRRPPSMVESLRNRQPPLSSAVQRPKSAHGYPILEGSQLSPEHILQVHTRDPADNSWLTTNPYATTPKFSRLGLASSGVVLPISAKEHKRMSRQTSKSSGDTSVSRTTRADSTSSSPGSGPTTPQQATLSPRTMKISDSDSFLESMQGSLRPRASATSGVTVVTNITLIAEGEEPDHRSESSSSSEPHELPHNAVPDVASKKGPLARLRTFGLRSIRSSNSLLSSRLVPINEKVKVQDGKSQSEIILGLSAHSSNSSTSQHSEEPKALPPSFEVPSKPSKRVSGVRRIWKSITGNWQLCRSH